jgi:hypothetical protein
LTAVTGGVLGLGVDIRWLQLAIGVFLLLFGVRWLAKAIARGAGLKAQHDEVQEFAETRAQLARGDWLARWLIAFKGVPRGKQSFGMPPHRFHMSQRIERAKTLLTKRHMSITEIAFEIGFGDASSFTAAFRRCAGRTPTEYRRSVF